MSFFSKRKRKNDDPPRLPAWVLVLIAIGLVIVVELLFQPVNISRSELVMVTASPDDPMLITATYIIEQATAQAQAVSQPLDPIMQTAQAQGTQSSDNLDPFVLTATAIVHEATVQAGTPAS